MGRLDFSCRSLDENIAEVMILNAFDIFLHLFYLVGVNKKCERKAVTIHYVQR